jgi:hypothetical protein
VRLRATLLLCAAAAACASYRLLPLPDPAPGALSPLPVRYEKTKLLLFKSVGEDAAPDALLSSGRALVATVTRPDSGVYTSGDAGRSWTLARVPAAGFAEVASDPRDPRRIFARAGSGVWRTADGGQTWSVSVPGGERIDALALGPDGTVYAGGRGRLFVSADGQAWKALSPQIPAKVWRARSILPDPAHPARVYLAVRTEPAEQKDLLTRFAALLQFSSDEALSALALADAHDAAPRSVSWGAPGDGVYVTHDGGALWTRTGLALDAWLALHGGALYAVAADPILRAASLVRRYPDLAGLTERQLRGDRADSASLRAACAWPGRDRLLAGPIGAALVFRSADSGATWARVEEPALPLAIALRAVLEQQGEDRPRVEARPEEPEEKRPMVPPPENWRTDVMGGRTRLPQRGAPAPAPRFRPGRRFTTQTALAFVDPARLLAQFNAGLPLTGVSGEVAYAPTQAHWDLLVAALASESASEGEISLGPAVPAYKETSFQLLRTPDAGATWTPLGAALPPGYPAYIAAAPEPIILLQGGASRRAWRIAP